jgi:hypothetical protein
MENHSSARARPWPGRLASDNAGSIAALGAIVIAVLLGVSAFAIELGNAYLVKEEDQRAADIAAVAGGIAYGANPNATALADTVSNIAQLNGLSSTAATASVVTSPTGDGNSAVEVAVTSNLPLRLARALGAGSSMNVSSSSWAELKASDESCIIALNASVTSLTMDNGSSLTGTDCSVGSKGPISMTGGTSMTVQAAYSGGTITTSGGSSITTTPTAGQTFQNYGSISDPIASNSSVQTAFSNLSKLSGSVSSPTTPSGGPTLTFNWSPSGTTDPTYPYYSGTGGVYSGGTLPCSGGSYAINSITVGGGINVTMNVTAGCNYTVANGIANNGASLNIVGTAGSWSINNGTASDAVSTGYSPLTFGNATTYTIAGGISVGGSGTLTFGNANFNISGGITTAGSSNTTFGYGTFDIAGSLSCGSDTGDALCLAGTVTFGASGSNTFNIYGGVTSGTGGGDTTFGNGNVNINGNFDLASGTTSVGNGLYQINGNLTNSGGGSLIEGSSGADTTTIVNSGAVTLTGGSTLTINAPASSATWGIPGIAFAGNNTASGSAYNVAISGGSHNTLAGVMYFPNANLQVTGGTSTGSSTCFELVAYTIYLSGGATAASTCAGFSSSLGIATARLVQ